MPARFNTYQPHPVASVPPLKFDIDSDDVVDGGSFQNLQAVIAAPFFILLVLVLTVLSVSVTWDERKDRSILFWKSMPVSDTKVVLAKFVFLGWLTTWATVLAVIIAQVIIAIVIDIYSAEALIAHLLTDVGFWSGLAQLLMFGLWFGVWLAPFLAWGMLVGSAAPRSPTLIAFIVPLLLFVFEELLFDTSYFSRFLAQQIDLDFSPGDDNGFPVTGEALATKSLGLIMAGALLAATVWSRRRFNEA